MKVNTEQQSRTTKYYYFTYNHRFKRFIGKGMIQTTSKNIDEEERPIVWLSSNADWENWQNQRIMIPNKTDSVYWGRNELFNNGVYLPVRVEIDSETTDIYSWKTFTEIGWITAFSIEVLERQAAVLGSDPSDWFVSFDDIPASSWKSTEVWDGTKWTTDIPGVLKRNASFLKATIIEPSEEDERRETERYRQTRKIMEGAMGNRAERRRRQREKRKYH